ncbi:hypothetical protein [Mycolicibacterium hodleri]|uniref:hypothetical protein n=1 Tax=Mycolicibacterium hodleri TaxID=49897 RepID=UPI003557EB84
MKPYAPESKGMVQRANRYLETSFLPGRSFASPQDFNDQLGQWLPIANKRLVRVLDDRSVDFLDADRARMLALPPVPPTVETRTSLAIRRRLGCSTAARPFQRRRSGWAVIRR